MSVQLNTQEAYVLEWIGRRGRPVPWAELEALAGRAVGISSDSMAGLLGDLVDSGHLVREHDGVGATYRPASA